MQVARLFRHLVAPHWLARRAFSAAALDEIERAVAAAERHHAGELRFVVEGGLPLADLLRGISARERAVEVFSRLRVWDTEDNSGVLIYVQLLDRRVEIVADRGIAVRVAQHEWDGISRAMEAAFRAGDFRGGAVAAVDSVGHLIATNFPAVGEKPNELPDRPVLL